MKSKPQILIIEDNLIVAEDMRLTVLSFGFDVTCTAASGEEAFASINEHKTDLAIVDIKLKSGESGIEVAKQLRFNYHVPVIFVTALTDDTTIEEIKKTEPYGYLTKPFKQAELRGVIETALYKNSVEHRLWESERQYRTLFETMLLGVVYQDKTGNILSVNPAAERILGISEREFQKRTSTSQEWGTVRPDGSPFPGEEHPSMVALKTGQRVEDVVMGVYNPKMEEYRWININAIPLFYPESNIPYQVYTTFEDITERRNHLEKIEHLNSVLQALRSINTLVAHAGQKEELLSSSCRLLTRYRGYYHAYIALKDKNGAYSTVFGAESEKTLADFEEILSKQDLPPCFEKVIGGESPYVALEPEIECAGCPIAEKYQHSAAMSVAVKHEHSIYGVMIVVLPLMFALDEEEKELFQEIADTIGFALFDLQQQRENERTQTELRQNLEEKETLLKEINHRVKNNLMIMKSLLSLQLEAKEHPDFRDASLDYISRIHAMAVVHERAYQSQRISRINTEEFIESVARDIIALRAPDIPITIVTEIEDQISLPIDTAVPLALILNELMTNSIRHAFTGYESGQVRIKFHEIDGQEYRMIVEDNGTGFSPLSSGDSSKSLGMQLINILIEQLNGKYMITSDNGTRAAISFPAQNRTRNKV